MGQKKLKRFREIKEFSNVLEYPEDMQGNWNRFFKNDFPIILELACGKGEYTVGLAAMHSDQNFIGVDIKGNRIWVGAKFAIDNALVNVAFLRTQIHKLDSYFAENEIEEIWITFPDPQLRLSRANRRLTHPRYLRLYHKILKPGGKIHLKTDSPDLYKFTKTVIDLFGLSIHADINNLHSGEEIPLQLQIKTHYESLNISESNCVFYICFTLPESLPDMESALEKIVKET